METIILFIRILFNILTLLVIVSVFISYFLSPYHPIRSAIDKIVNPLLNPIRKLVPSIQGLDFSPLILLIILQLLEYLLIGLLVKI